MKNLSKAINFFILILFIYFILNIEYLEISRANTNIFNLSLGFLFIFLTYLFAILKYFFLINNYYAGKNINAKKIACDYAKSNFISFISPISTLGDLNRIIKLKQSFLESTFKSSSHIVLYDKFSGLASLALIILISSYWYDEPIKYYFSLISAVILTSYTLYSVYFFLYYKKYNFLLNNAIIYILLCLLTSIFSVLTFYFCIISFQYVDVYKSIFPLSTTLTISSLPIINGGWGVREMVIYFFINTPPISSGLLVLSSILYGIMHIITSLFFYMILKLK